MIGWLNPGALAALALIGLPVIVHLLRTHHAERILFPSLRFVAVSRTASVRVHLPSDWLLLLVRIGIVIAAVLAAAQPLVLTPARLRAWNERRSRAVVVDAGESMRLPDASGKAPAAAANEAALAEIGSAQASIRLDAPVLSDAIARATAWLAVAPPARRELVVISNFRTGALGVPDFADVPPEIGLRLVRVEDAVTERVVSGTVMLGAPGVPPRAQEIQLQGAQTGVRLTTRPERAGDASTGVAAPALPGLRFIAEEGASFEPLWRTVALAGAPAPSPDEPLVFEFGGAAVTEGAPVAIGPVAPRWMLRTALRARDDQSLMRAARATATTSLAASEPWTVIASDQQGAPVVRVAVRGPALVTEVGAPADSLLAATVVRAVLQARQGGTARPEQEIMRVDTREIASWARPAGEVGREAWQHADGSDARWLWLSALALLLVERRLRRAAAGAAAVEARHAA